MYSLPLLLLAASAITDQFVSACTHAAAAEAAANGHALRRRGPQPEPVRNVRRAQSTPVAITNVKYFTGTGLSGLSTVQFAGGVITAVLSGADTGVPSTFKVINANGGTLLPGFIESHTHPDTLAELQQLTSYGITTAMGMGCASYQNCNALRGQTGLADFYSAGVAGCTNGSLHESILQYPQQDLIFNTSEAQSWVQARISEGSNWIKLIAEDPGLTTAEHTAFVAAAHANGKKTATHAAALDNYEQAITSKTDWIQHAPLDAVLTAAQVSQIKSQGQIVTPTLTILRLLASSPYDAPGGTYANAEASVTALYKGGVTLLVGTDSDDVLGPYSAAFGSSFYDELENLVAAGLPPVTVLNAGTSVPASVYGFSDRGSIAVGKRADLVLVSGDPTTDISNARNIQDVWVTGIQYTPVA